jgi:predicted CoA-binding protein
MPDDLAALITAQALEGTIHGIEPKMNHSNTNISRYGITVMYANTTKSYAVYRRTPISLKYPKLDEDKNAEVLASLVKDMSVIVTRNMSHDAFKAANRHFNYLYDNNGMKIVPINDDSNSILPGQHFLTTTAIDSKIKLSEEVSTLDTSDALKNIRSALVNKIYDIITAIRINSNISALKEMDSRKETYIIVAHASLAPFLMEVGDYRTFGKDIDFEVIETNIDTEVGRMWIFPKSHTTENNIDVFGGLGINVAKESLVIEGFVGQSDRQYRMILTQPAYQHHDICPVLGRLTIEDIKDLLGDEGLISKINKLLIRGDLITSEPDDDVVIDLP